MLLLNMSRQRLYRILLIYELLSVLKCTLLLTSVLEIDFNFPELVLELIANMHYQVNQESRDDQPGQCEALSDSWSVFAKQAKQEH